MTSEIKIAQRIPGPIVRDRYGDIVENLPRPDEAERYTNWRRRWKSMIQTLTPIQRKALKDELLEASDD